MIAGARNASIADRCALWLGLPLTLCLLSCQSGEQPAAPAASEVALVSAAPDQPLPWPPSYDTSALPEEAGRTVTQLLEDFPHDAEAVFACGWIFNYFWRFDEAERCCNDCLALDPKYAKAHNLIAQVKNRHGDFAGAADHLRQAIELDPELDEAGLQLGTVLLGMGKPEEALPVLERQAARHPAPPEWFYVGQAHFQLRDYARAKEAYEKSLGLDQTIAAGWFGLAQTCERLGETERARQCRERFRELDADNGAFHREVRTAPPSDEASVAVVLAFTAKIYYRGGKPAEAEALRRRVIALDPAKVEYREDLGRMLIADGRAADAVPVLEELRKMKPQDITVLFSLSDLYSRLNDRANAKACLRQIIVMAPDNSLAAAKLAQFYLNDGEELTEARRLAERASRLNPSGETWYLLSALCLANQDRSGAKYALIEALRLEPRNPKYLESARVLISPESQP